MKIMTNQNSGLANTNQLRFTAQLKGSAVLSAINKSKTLTELAELREVIDNIKNFGDVTTEICCENNGIVKVSNRKFGNIFDSFKLSLNEKSENPFLDMLKIFNTENRVIKCELDLLERRFSHTKNKKALYELYKTYDLSVVTKSALNTIAANYGLVKSSANANEKFNNLEVLKRMFFPEYFKD